MPAFAQLGDQEKGEFNNDERRQVRSAASMLVHRAATDMDDAPMTQLLRASRNKARDKRPNP
jgi:hypothetical protein